jgi:hypothetical protein
MGRSWVFKSESILPNVTGRKKEEVFLFDLQTVGFWVLKNATFIAPIIASEILFFMGQVALY